MSTNNQVKFVVKKFDINKINCNECVLIIGKAASGKTHLIKHIMNHKKDIKNVYTMNGLYEGYTVIDAHEDKGNRILTIDDVSLENRVEFHKLFANKPSSDILTIIGTQNPNIPIVIKNNVDYVFIFNNTNDEYLKKIYIERMNKIFEPLQVNSLDSFTKIIKEITVEQYTTVVIDLKTNNIFWYKT